MAKANVLFFFGGGGFFPSLLDEGGEWRIPFTTQSTSVTIVVALEVKQSYYL
jgi:hypothetical protein